MGPSVDKSHAGLRFVLERKSCRSSPARTIHVTAADGVATNDSQSSLKK
jgi:hypothetical protein